MTEVSFGEWLKRQRSGRGLTQEQLAQQIGCAGITLRKIESEQRRPSAQIVERLAEIFNIPQNEHAAFLRFARGDWTKAPGEVIGEAPWRVESNSTTPTSLSSKPKNNLPAQLTSFIGREREIEAVKQAINQFRLVTLTGSGGTGKTRLSLQIAEDLLKHFEYIWFIELAQISDPEDIPQSILSTIGLSEQQGKTAQELISEYLQGKNALMVLDNCEHLIEATAKFAYFLLNQAPALKILASSRETLGVEGEVARHVPSLSMPNLDHLPGFDELSQYESIRLFYERAALARPDFTATKETAASVAQICGRLDGIPLAIELAASRVKTLGVDQIARRLDDRFRLLTGGARTALPRQQTLRATIDWSYNLLTEPERGLLRYLTVFSGGWTLEAAERIWGQQRGDQVALDLLTQLVDKSMVIVGERGGLPRYRMLESTRQYAREKLLDSDEGEAAHHEHSSYFLDLAKEAEDEIHGSDQTDWLNKIENEYDNFRAALEWCVSAKDTESAIALLSSLEWHWRLRSHLYETRNWLNTIMRLPDTNEYPAQYGRLLVRVGRTSWILGEGQVAQSLLEQGHAICSKLGAGSEQDLAEALDFLGMIEIDQNVDSGKAETYFKQSLELYQKWGNQHGAGECKFHLGLLEKARGNDSPALAYFEQALSLFQKLGDLWRIARVSMHIGDLCLQQGDYEEAGMYFDKQLLIDEKLQFGYGQSNALSLLGEIHRHQGNYQKAEAFYNKSLAIAEEHGIERINYFPSYCLSLLALHQNEYELARNRFAQFVQIARRVGEKYIACDVLIGSAAIAAGSGQPELCARLYGAAQTALESFDHHISTFDEKEFNRHIQIARNRLGEEAFESFQAKGRAMSLEQAIIFALEA